MFICQTCGTTTLPREPQSLRVVETRKKVYSHWNEEECKMVESEGSEIVKEIAECQECRGKGINP